MATIPGRIDDLLATYSEITRRRANPTICVGGGIGTPERAAEYLSGWAVAYDYPADAGRRHPGGYRSDGSLEATTSPQVKQLLVDTTGTDRWSVPKGGAAWHPGVASSGADIHEIDNAASRCGRLLDDVAGDAGARWPSAATDHRAAGGHRQPYFGDVGVRRLGHPLREARGARDRRRRLDRGTPWGDSPWLDITWRDRWSSMLQRAERLHPEFRAHRTMYERRRQCGRSVASVIRPVPLPRCWRGAGRRSGPAAPADVPFFIDL